MSKRIIIKIDSMSPAVKASFALMGTQLIQKGLSLITSPIYTRMLTTYEYGEVSLFFSWYEIFVIFTGLCLSKGVFNNGMLEYRDDRERFALSMYSLSVCSSLFVGAIVAVVCKYTYNFIGLPIELILYMFLLLTFEEALAIWNVKNRFEYKYKATSIITIIIAIVSPLCGILGIYLFPSQKVVARIIGAQNVFLTVYIGVLIYLIIKARGKVKVNYWKYALSFNLPLLPHYLSLHILSHMDRIMISSIVSKDAAGIYSIAYSGSAVVMVFWQSINASLIPWTYEKCEKKEFQRLSELTKVLIFGYGLMCIAFMFLAPEIMKVLAPNTYHEGIYVIPSVTAGVFFSSIYYIFANVVYYYKKPKYVMVASVTSAICNMVLNAFFIPKFGYIAAGYTTMASYIIQAVIDYWAMRKIVGQDIYDTRFLTCFGCLIIIMSVALSFIYQYTVLRVIMFCIFASYCVVYLRKNISILKSIFNKKGEIL